MGSLRSTIAATVALLRADAPQARPQDASEIAAVLRAVIVITNLAGAAAVLAVSYAVIPLPTVDDVGRVRAINAVVAAAYIAVAVTTGRVLGTRALQALVDWTASDAPADERIRRMIVTAPVTLFRLQLRFWLAAAVLFAAVNAATSVTLAAVVAVTVAITGLSTGACAYLLTERLLRGAASRALAGGMPAGDVTVPGVATRAMLAWALGSGGPVLGVIAIGVVALAGGEATSRQLEVAMVALGAIAVGVGLLAVSLAARATADPVEAVSDALHQVEDGEFGVRVPVYDATQIGRLQLGFNRMAEGLQERERIRSALGVYVDPDVAERIVAEGVELAGEEVEVTVMFVDVRDFTGFAERATPTEVIAAVNTLFERIIPIVHEHGGRIDKFVGDGLMAVFGAPRRLPAHADAALATALQIQDDLARADLPLQIGIGLNSGTVLAGNVGGAGRLEYSVMGDAVNVAARVEAATRQTGDQILVSAHTCRLLRGSDVPLTERPGVTLKGRRESVSVFAPARAPGSPD